MTKKTIITILGVLVMILPFVGMPTSFSKPIFFLAGLGIVLVARSAGKKKVMQN